MTQSVQKTGLSQTVQFIKKHKKTVLLAAAFAAALLIPALSWFVSVQKTPANLYDYRILQEYGFDGITNKLRITSIDEIYAKKSEVGLTATLHNVKSSPTLFRLEAQFIDNLKKYKPYTDFFNLFPETLAIGGCRKINSDITFKVFPVNDMNRYKTEITLQDECLGSVKLGFTVINPSDEMLTQLKSALNAASFATAVKLISTDNIVLEFIPSQEFFTNYTFAGLTTFPDITDKSKEQVIAETLQLYEKYLTENKVPAKTIINNLQVFTDFLNKGDSASTDDNRIYLQIRFTSPVLLNELKSFIPLAVLSATPPL